MVDHCEKEVPTREALLLRGGAVSIEFMNCEADLKGMECPYPARSCRYKIEADIFREVCVEKINQAIVEAICEIDQILAGALAVQENP